MTIHSFLKYRQLATLMSLLSPALLQAQSEGAYAYLNDVVSATSRSFHLFRNRDDGGNMGYPSGLFGEISRVEIDSGCVDDPDNRTTGCATDPTKVDCERGDVLRITWLPLRPNTFAGLNIEEPEHYGAQPRGNGYDLRPATHLVFRYRSPTGIRVQFGLGRGTTDFVPIPASRNWAEMRLEISRMRPAPDLSDAHILFTVVTNADNAPQGGTLLVDDVRLEPVPARQAAVLSFPLANKTCGVIPVQDVNPGRVPIPSDQVNRNLTTVYESSLVLWALLQRGTPEDLRNARALANTFARAIEVDSSGWPLPKTGDGKAGWRNAYLNGAAFFHNDQAPGGAKRGEPKLAGFSASTKLCGPSGFCLVLDGATGGNTSFSILAMLAAWRQFRDERYLNAARTAAEWIHGNLYDSDPSGFQGYFLGYPDEGALKILIRGKSVENNADIAAAFEALAAVERELCKMQEAAEWSRRSAEAGDYVIRMYDRTNNRFFAGSVPVGTTGTGICPDGEVRGSEVISTCDYLDANTFIPLALIDLPRYRQAIDWRKPVQWALDHQAQTVRVADREFRGFNIVDRPTAGPNGIALEFTAQMVVTMRLVDRLYGESQFGAIADLYAAQIGQAQSAAPFGDGRGVVAAVLDGGDRLPPYEHCLSTPFQCIAQRVGLAATVWAIFSDKTLNPLQQFRHNSENSSRVVNAASFQPCASVGSLFTVLGPQIVSSNAVAERIPLVTELGGVRALVGGVPAPLLFVGGGQVNGQLPYEVPTGDTTVELFRNGTLHSSTEFKVAPVAPGIFAHQGNACIAHNASGSVNGPDSPAGPAETITIYLTGVGVPDRALRSGEASPSDPLVRPRADVRVRVGGQEAQIAFAGFTPGVVGVAQANFTLNPVTALGEQEVIVEVGQVPSAGCLIYLGERGIALPAEIISVSPRTSPVTGGARVRIAGRNFYARGMKVLFGAAPAAEVRTIDRNTLEAIAPAGLGIVDVAVVVPSGRSAVLARGFAYESPSPTLSTLVPNTGPASGGTRVVLTGSGFQNGTTIRFGGTAAASVTYRSTTSLEAVTPAGSGAVAVIVANPDGKSASLANGFTYGAPERPNPAITARVQGCRVSGAITGVSAPQAYKIVLYAHTTPPALFWIQPCDTERIQSIDANGNWGPIDTHNGNIYVLLVRNGYVPPATTSSLPRVDGADVLAITGPLGTVNGCDVARCPAR